MSGMSEMLTKMFTAEGKQAQDPSQINGLSEQTPVVENPSNPVATTTDTAVVASEELTPTPVTDNDPVAPKAETPVESTKTEPAFDRDKIIQEYLSEKTEGKYSKWEDVDTKLKEEKVEFSNDFAKKFNDFSKGFDNPEEAMDVFVRTQTTNYNEITDPIELLSEDYSFKHPNLTDEEISELIKDEYKIEEWADEGEEPTVAEKRAKIRMKLASEEARKRLLDNQNKWAAKSNKPTQEELAQTELNKKAVKQKWNDDVTKEISTFDKLSLKLSDTETVDYVLGDDEKKEVSSMVKKLSEDANVFWNQFIKDGDFDKRAIIDAMLKLKSFDKVVKFAVDKAKASGGESVVKDLKNTNFTSKDQRNTPAPKSREDYVAEHFSGKI